MMMKMTFEGKTLGDILDEMQGMLEKFKPSMLTAGKPALYPKVTDPRGHCPKAKAMEASDCGQACGQACGKAGPHREATGQRREDAGRRAGQGCRQAGRQGEKHSRMQTL